MWIRTLSLALLCAALQAMDCAALSQLALPRAEITQAELISGGTYQPSYGQALTGLPPFCRVAVTAKPTSDSDIRIEVWMPQSGWNSRFEGTGNGGFAGRISYGALGTGVKLGYAVANTNMGTGTPPDQDAAIFTGHPEAWADWGYRATHEMTTISKQIVQAYYDQAPKHNYFSGCSTGGEQALMESQRYPDDYDGIVAGAPANNRTGVHLSILWNFVAATHAPIPKSKLPGLNEAVIRACDALDGVEDRIIANPAACHFDPATLLCSGSDSDSCLTAPQVETARQLYAGPANPRTHQKLYPGLTPGSEFGWDQLAPKAQPPYAPIFQWVFGRDWDWHTFDFDRAADTYRRKLAATLNAMNPSLDRFRSKGHKLVVYHGWADWLVAPGESINLYNQIAAANKNSDDFYRLFMVPGMAHCSGGPGEDRIDPLTAVVNWVEKGEAPPNLVATKPATGQRLLCPYPQTAHYNGAGDIHQAASYTCATAR
jgi:feruloyl esterase